MGSGASREEDVIRENGVAQSPAVSGQRVPPMTPSTSMQGYAATHPSHNRPASQISRQLSKSSFARSDGGQSSRPILQRKNTVSKFIEGYEQAEVFVSKSGFSMQNIQIMEGQTIKFRWDTEDNTSLNIIQVVHDGEKLRPVIGGYGCSQSQADGLFEQQFNLEGDYKFAISGIRSTPLTVLVRPRVDLQAEVTDYGFSPKVINIDKGHTVKWSWVQCSVPHSVQEVTYDICKGGFVKPSNANSNTFTSTVSGSYRHSFKRSGLYYFQTDGMDLGKTHLCIVHVRETQKECKVEVLDRSFSPMIVLIEEGDRVWWHWDRFKCKKFHSIYQIHAPGKDHPPSEQYEPVKDGFRWTAPSKQGLLSYQFHVPGVYYFSDQNFEEAAEYIGTVIVKPKQKEHYIELSENGFSPDLWYTQTGDRIWWTWSGHHVDRMDSTFTICEIEKTLNPATKQESTDEGAQWQYMDEEAAKLCTRLGLATVQYNTVGVYHYRVTETRNAVSTCSVIVNPGPKNYTIHLTDNGFEPKVMTIRPNDRVWWVWQTGQKQHNIVQVSHQGSPIEGGFGSGAPRDCPSAFVHQFHSPGVFYFKSLNLPKMFGAVVVSTQPQVHEVQVARAKLTPDPVVVMVNDIVCWVYPGLRHHQLREVKTVDEILKTDSTVAIAPRRCMSKAITQQGVFHFCSKSFQKGKKDKDNNADEVRLSTVISDDRFDNSVVQVNKFGFHPAQLYVQKGESVLWTWKINDEPHNIIHVTAADSQAPLNVVQGPNSFNSGKPVPNNSFLYTFDEIGVFTVASQGAPGCSCTIHVLEHAERCKEPYIVSSPNGGTVERYTTVQLHCDTPGAKIFYTTDGSKPDLHSQSSEVYTDGVILNHSGLHFIRAIAVCDGVLTSHVMTSKRYWVLSQETDDEIESESNKMMEKEVPLKAPVMDMTESWKWLSCAPTIKGCVTQPGELEIFWEPPPADCLPMVLGYQIYLNGISYCEMFPPEQNTINVAGLAGGRQYEIHVSVFPKSEKFSHQESNKLLLRCPLATHDHGPVISLETTNRPDSLAVVWMSIDTEFEPITGYILFLNDAQVGQTLVPDKDSNRCKVVVEGCDLDVLYKVVVFALPKGIADISSYIRGAGGKPKTSNLLEILLPLKTAPIVLPPPHRRLEDEDLYREFLEIREGSGYLPSMDQVDQNVEGASEATQTVARRQPKGAEVTSHDISKGTQTPWRGKEILDPSQVGRDSRKGIGYGSSDSESGTDDDEHEGEGICTINMTGSGQTVMAAEQQRSGPARGTNGGVEIDLDGVETADSTIVTQALVHDRGDRRPKTGKPKKLRRRKRPKSAIIDVHDAAEFNADEALYEDGRKRLRVVKIPALRSAPPGERLPRPDLEGQFIVCDADGLLPAPSVLVESRGRDSVKVEWELPRQPDPEYRLLIYVVNVIGEAFDSNVNSDMSFDCNVDDKGKRVSAIQHCWNITGKHKCLIQGLMPNRLYRIYVVANYTMVHGPKPSEFQTTSSVLYYTTLGASKPPNLKILSVDLYQTCLEWELAEVHEDYRVKGFRIFINNKQHPDLQPRRIRQLIINHMIPGDTLSIAVMAISKHAGYNSDLSRTVRITCPRRPPAPIISQQPSYKKGCVLVAWDKPTGHMRSGRDDDISLYCVYTDDRWYGEIRANASSDKQGYQFFLTDLTPAQNYDVAVKTICGPRRVDSKADHVFCLSDSPFSNVLPVMAPAAPHSPKLRIEGLHPEGIDVTWQVPQQYGDAGISGYQMLKNGKLYGSVIPPDVNSLRIKDLILGEKVTLQVIALTDHPVGRSDMALTDKDSGIDGSSQPEERAGTLKVMAFQVQNRPRIHQISEDLLVGEKYAGCKPGARLVLHYSGLVIPPSKVWAEEVTGHSALVVWKVDDHPKSHFVRAESYQVTWWPGDKPEDDINSDSTTADHLLITNLKPSTTYTVVVEARKMQRYSDVDEDGKTTEDDGLSAFILTSKSEQMKIKTASPPEAATHLGVVATTCNSIRLAWNPPKEHGVEVIGIRVDCTPAKSHNPDEHVCVDLMPDATTAILEGLAEHTDYMICVTAVTQEFFETLPEKHRLKKLHALPKDARVGPDDSQWLPCATIMGTTSGTDRPCNLQVMKATTSSLSISWTPAVAYGSNVLQGTIVRWVDRQTAKNKDEDLMVASYVNLLANQSTLTIEDLIPGAQYRIVVEAVVSLKTSLDADRPDGRKGENRRTAHVMSEPLYTRTRAPTEPPRLQLVGLTSDTCRLYWEKPILLNVVSKDENDQPNYVRRYLEGYKIEINGKEHMTLGPSAQTCSLTKCKPGRTYSVVLVALSCTAEVKKDRKKRHKTLFKKGGGQSEEYSLVLDDESDLDTSPSEPLRITMPKPQTGFLSSLEGEFHRSESDDRNLCGEIQLKWETYGETVNLLRQFNILWFSEDDRVIQTKYVGPDQRSCTIPVISNKVVYNVSVEPSFYSETPQSSPQSLQIMIPGQPDAPEIFLESVDTEEFVVEWGEPRLYGGVKVRGYQVYLNDRKAGNELNSSYRKAIIPCRPNRHYKMNLIALSANPEYPDSFKSNSLLISSGPRSPRHGEGSSTMTLEDWSSMTDDQEIVLKVSSITDTAIHLDWSTHLETDGVRCYKVQWSSVAQPDQREVKLDVSESSCVINKCLPGTTHFVRVISVSPDGNILGKSRQLTIQTSAPPDAPKLAVRACNFRYIAIQWDKPITYGDAGINGYKVYINGVVEASLTPQQLSFTFTHGAWCQEYCFQVQAMCTVDRLNSKISEPLIIAWPGVKSPVLERIPTISSRAVRVRWETPYCTEGVTVKHFKLLCVDVNTGKTVQSLGPLHPNMREAEIRGLHKSSYSLYLETHVHGTSDVVVSTPMSTHPAVLPDPPELVVSVIGLEERRQLNRVTSELVNKRDRLIRKVGHQIKKMGIANHAKLKDKNQEILKAAQTLSTIEDLLESCFHGLAEYSGHVMVHLSWQCIQTNRDVEVTGYQVLVDGKHYGNALVPGVRGVRVKLDLDQPSHTISVLALTSNQIVTSESNEVKVLTEAFQPFSFYCYHDVHRRSVSWPSRGCCRFDDSVIYERQLAKKLANQGLLKKQVPPPACSLLDVFDGEFKPLLTHNKLSHATVMLFWTPWCLASKGVMNHFVKFARDNSKRHNFIAISSNYDARQPHDRQQLIHTITENGWRDDLAVWHCTSHCASSVSTLPNNISRSKLAKPGQYPEDDYDTGDFVDITELLGIAGVPTFLFIHQDGYIAWHGRYCANSYKDFSGFMNRTFEEVSGGMLNHDITDDTQIDPEIYDVLLKFESSTSNPSTMKVGVTEDVTQAPMLLPLSDYPPFNRRPKSSSSHPDNHPGNKKRLSSHKKKLLRGKKKGVRSGSNTVLFST